MSKEKIGPCGVSNEEVAGLITATGLYTGEPTFTQRQMVLRVMDMLVEQGRLRVVDKDKDVSWFGITERYMEFLKAEINTALDYLERTGKIKRL